MSSISFTPGTGASPLWWAVPLLAVAAALVIIVLRHRSAPAQTLSRNLVAAARSAAVDEIMLVTQNSLERNMQQLTELVAEKGEVRVMGGQLYFGDHLVNDNHEIVDRVRDVAGGTATIFLRDTRISTNVKKPDGGRAVGTKLTAAPVLKAVLTENISFRGEAEILGTPYLTIYEPLCAEGEVVGVLFVGVPKAEFTGQIETANALDSLVNANKAAVRIALEAASDRQRADDTRRHQEMRREVRARERREVVQTMSAALDRLAAADLTQPLETPFPAEYEKLRNDFNGALGMLAQLVRDITGSVDSICSRGSEISRAAEDLSRRTEIQAGTLEETASALSHATSGIRQMATGAKAAKQAVRESCTDVESCGERMRHVTDAMQMIEKSSQDMASVVSTMDEITLQTNLLALNAGVEAARAGDAGRGFAVVAQEVRALSIRSVEAAREVRRLIAVSAEQVHVGARHVSETDAALQSVMAHFGQIDQLVSGIATSVEEQSASIEQINTAVSQMDQVTQQNAAMAEQSTAVSHSLADESQELAALTAKFQLKQASRGRFDGSAQREQSSPTRRMAVAG